MDSTVCAIGSERQIQFSSFDRWYKFVLEMGFVVNDTSKLTSWRDTQLLFGFHDWYIKFGNWVTDGGFTYLYDFLLWLLLMLCLFHIFMEPPQLIFDACLIEIFWGVCWVCVCAVDCNILQKTIRKIVYLKFKSCLKVRHFQSSWSWRRPLIDGSVSPNFQFFHQKFNFSFFHFGTLSHFTGKYFHHSSQVFLNA